MEANDHNRPLQPKNVLASKIPQRTSENRNVPAWLRYEQFVDYLLKETRDGTKRRFRCRKDRHIEEIGRFSMEPIKSTKESKIEEVTIEIVDLLETIMDEGQYQESGEIIVEKLQQWFDN